MRLLVFAFIGLGACAQIRQSTQVSINNNGLEKEGIEIRQGSELYIAEIWNRSQRTILEFLVRVEEGGSRGGYTTMSFPKMTAPGAHAAFPVPKLNSLTPIDITLESVLWDDFTCSGPGGCDEPLARMKSERDLYMEILSASSVSDDAVIQKLRDAGKYEPMRFVGPNRTYENFYAFFKQRKAKTLSADPRIPGSVAALIDLARRELATTKYPQ